MSIPINKELEYKRQKLYELLIDGRSLNDPDIIKLSESLDKHILPVTVLLTQKAVSK